MFNRNKKLYWYSVKITYNDKNYRAVFTHTFEVGMYKQQDVLNHRKVKALINPLNRMDHVKHLLCNGTLGLQVVCFLGRFRLG